MSMTAIPGYTLGTSSFARSPLSDAAKHIHRWYLIGSSEVELMLSAWFESVTLQATPWSAACSNAASR